MFKETKTRSVLKTISWRLLATFTTATLVFIFTRRIKLALAIGSLEAIAKMIFYFFHERVWDKINFGRKEIIPFVLWFTGLPSSGKHTVAQAVYSILADKKYNVEVLSGEKVRAIFPRTGFSKESRNDHIEKVGFLASILEKNRVIVVASFISPYKEARDFVRVQCTNFIEVYMSTPIGECERRDSKGLYKKARQGLIKNVTGIDDPYEIPNNPELTINIGQTSPEEAVKEVLNYLRRKKFLN